MNATVAGRKNDSPNFNTAALRKVGLDVASAASCFPPATQGGAFGVWCVNQPPAFQFYPDDFIGGTVDMTAEDCGAYIRLLCYQWGHGKAWVSKDDIDRIAGCHVSDKVLGKFPRGKNMRLERERAKQIEYRQKQAINGAKGGRPRERLGLGLGYSGETQTITQTKAKKSSPSPSPIVEREYARAHEPEVNGNPTKQEVLAKAQFIGLAEWRASDWWDEMQGCGWKDHLGRTVVDWVAILTRVTRKWESDGRPDSPPKPRSAKGQEQAQTDTILDKQLRENRRMVERLCERPL